MSFSKELNKEQLSCILDAIPQSAKHARNLIQYLTEHPNTTAEQISRDCLIANVSDVARKVNPMLMEHGLFIGCSVPATPRQFHYGNKPAKPQWAIHVLPDEAANDVQHQQRQVR